MRSKYKTMSDTPNRKNIFTVAKNRIKKFFNDFWLEHIPVMIVAAKEKRRPKCMKRSTVLLRLYFPLKIDLKYFLL